MDDNAYQSQWREVRRESQWERDDIRRGLILSVVRAADGWLWVVLDAHGAPVASGTGASADDAREQADRAGG